MIVARKDAVAAVGLDISDSHIRFLELDPRKDLLLPKTYGNIPLPYGTVVQGEVKQETVLVDILKDLFDKTSGQVVSFERRSIGTMTEEWSELLRVAGFSERLSFTKEEVLPFILNTNRREQLIYGEFVGSALQIRRTDGANIQSLIYPFDQGTRSVLDGLLSDNTQSHLPIIGILPDTSKKLRKAINDNELPMQLQNIWWGCFGFDRFVPALEFDSSFTFGWSVAFAHCAARNTCTKEATDDSKTNIRHTYASLEKISQPRAEQTKERKESSISKIATATTFAKEESRKSSVSRQTNSDHQMFQKKRSVWLRDVDEIIYGMLGMEQKN